jgi:hypothetical protein
MTSVDGMRRRPEESSLSGEGLGPSVDQFFGCRLDASQSRTERHI